MTRVLAVVLVLTSWWPGCGPRDPEVLYYRSPGYQFTRADRDVIEAVAAGAVADARRQLPRIPRDLTLRVGAGPRVSAETGEDGSFTAPNVLYWEVDPHHPGGVAGIARAHLRGSLLPLLYHLARLQTVRDRTLLDWTITVGLATVFARDIGHADVKWDRVPADVDAWVAEVLAAGSSTPSNDWMVRHPDGRRWVAPTVGTVLARRAMRESGRSAAELVHVPSAEILRLARTPVPGPTSNSDQEGP